MNRDDLIALASRVEALTGPDREVDAEIDIALGLFPERAYEQRMGCRPKGSPMIDRKEWMVRDGFTRPFTRSLDQAIVLVPEGLRFELTTTGFKPGATVCGDSLNGVHAGSYAATPAIALTAASLRAMAEGA